MITRHPLLSSWLGSYEQGHLNSKLLVVSHGSSSETIGGDCLGLAVGHGHCKPHCGSSPSLRRSSFAATAAVACASGIRRRISVRRRAESGAEREAAAVKCGDSLSARVIEVVDAGLLLETADGLKAQNSHALADQQQEAELNGMCVSQEEYAVDDVLEIVVRRQATAWSGKDALWATDRSLMPLSSVERGSLVDGRVLNISDVGVLLDINVPRHGFACWEHLTPLREDLADLKVGDTIHGLKVRNVNPSNVQLGAASLQLHSTSDFKVGEVVSGVVVNIAKKINAVFFDIGAPTDAAARGGKKQLAKKARRYVHGEAMLLEVVKVEGEKIDVKDLAA